MSYLPSRKAAAQLGLHPSNPEALCPTRENPLLSKLRRTAALRRRRLPARRGGPRDRLLLPGQLSQTARRPPAAGGTHARALPCKPRLSLTSPEGSTGGERDSVSILERLHRGDKLQIVVAHRDRLARFGFELIQWLVEQNGGEVLVLNQPDASPESELTEDLLAILHTFSCRLQGLRRYRTAIAEDKGLSHDTAEVGDKDLA